MPDHPCGFLQGLAIGRGRSSVLDQANGICVSESIHNQFARPLGSGFF